MRAGHDRRLGPHAAALRERPELDVAARERDQVRRNRLVHPESEDAGRVAADVLRAHHDGESGRRANARVISDADPRRVLQRNPRAREDRLALREEERRPAVGGLLGREPLQRVGARGRPVVNRHRAIVRSELDRERRADDRRFLTQREFPRVVVRAEHGLDRESLRIENERRALVEPLERERDGPRGFTARHVERQVEADVRDTHTVRLGVAVCVHGEPRRRISVRGAILRGARSATTEDERQGEECGVELAHGENTRVRRGICKWPIAAFL